MINLKSVEENVLAGLKDFQKATVERVYELLTGKHSRVLVAGEVGLGKTLIARGTIAKLARYHQEKLNDDLFKVVYVCSNQTIASQNINKLKLNKNVRVENASDTRLSMQHLQIFKNNCDESLKKDYIQLIPLTPMTSFHMTRGEGNYNERGLMFAVLSKYEPFLSVQSGLSCLLQNGVSNWERITDHFKNEVEACDEGNKGEYIRTILSKVDENFKNDPAFFEDIVLACKLLQSGKQAENKYRVIHKLRKLMADISVDLIQPDLVIMDEFQRFSELIETESDSETAILAKKFFSLHQNNDGKVKVLLLSATPYKLYSTREELMEDSENSHYQEFETVTNFLFEDNLEHKQEFRSVWQDYSKAIGQLTAGNTAIILAKKQAAEEALYKGIVRTERMLVNGSEAMIDVSNQNGKLKVSTDDLLSYHAMYSLMNTCGFREKVQTEYIKSAPYLMSYMEHYKIKDKITDYFKLHPKEVNKANNHLLWLNKDVINRYGEIPISNARLVNVMENAIPKGAEKLIWIPPSLPYYEFGGCYKDQEHFSKVLVFSAWEMVPRSIATMISYESERRTVGELIDRSVPGKQKKMKKKQRKKVKRPESMTYFGKSRFPKQRFTFKLKNGDPANMNSLCLLYPSMSLADLFDPIDTLNKGFSLSDLKEQIKAKIQEKLDGLVYIKDEENNREDQHWYFMAPLLMDKQNAVVHGWFEEGVYSDEIDNNALQSHFERLKELYFQDKITMGKFPEDLLDVLTNMAIGSPAIAALRMLKHKSPSALKDAVMIGKTLMERFNSQEGIAIVDLVYGSKSEDAHWKNVLKYCVDGNIQAMFDEYAHLLTDGKSISEDERKGITSTMNESIKTHSASLNVDTFDSFKDRVLNGGKNTKEEKQMKLRTNFAVGLYDMKTSDNSFRRKDSVIKAFNSPFRPFVLASTSVGQEGLDFHYYCRKVVHWNLPANPIDLEQREGRVNRYKCLAIRKNIAYKYRSIEYKTDIWKEIFNAAEQERKKEMCELVPYWCLPGEQPFKIERIVPKYPLSKDGAKYNRLMKILSLYRLSLGQARQEELLEYLLDNDFPEEQLKGLFMNLSPFYKDIEYEEK